MSSQNWDETRTEGMRSTCMVASEGFSAMQMKGEQTQDYETSYSSHSSGEVAKKGPLHRFVEFKSV